MTDDSTKTLSGHSPNRIGIAALIAAGLAFLSWPLMFIIGFVMVYAAGLFALVAIVLGLLGIGTGIYFREPVAVITGALAVTLTIVGVSFIFSALANF